MGDIGNGSINWMLIGIVGGAVALAILVVVLIIVISGRKKKNKEPESTIVADNNLWVKALGGKDNIINLEAKGSRLVVYIKDNKIIDKDELHNLGVNSLIVSQDKVTLVLKEKAENIYNLLK